MRKIVFQAHADTMGTDTAKLHIYPADVTEKELDEDAQQFGQNHWESYDSSETEEESDEYYEACDAWWEDYDPVKHAGMVDDPDEE